jgi:hypothetical protein
MGIRLRIVPCSRQRRRTIGTLDAEQGAPGRRDEPEDKPLHVGSPHVAHGYHVLCCYTEKSKAEAREIKSIVK